MIGAARRRARALLVVMIILPLTASACATASAADASVRMRATMKFDPATIEVPVGATVTWENDGHRPHTVTAIDPDRTPTGRFDSGEIIGTGRFSHTFEEEGAYSYQCEIHADQEMVGVVVVTS